LGIFVDAGPTVTEKELDVNSKEAKDLVAEAVNAFSKTDSKGPLHVNKVLKVAKEFTRCICYVIELDANLNGAKVKFTAKLNGPKNLRSYSFAWKSYPVFQKF